MSRGRSEGAGGPIVALPPKLIRTIAANSLQDALHQVDELPFGVRSTLRDASGSTMVHLACASNSSELLFNLVHADKRNMSVNVVDLSGNHPLHICAAHGHVEHARLLLERGVNPLVLNGDGETPIDVAERNGCDYFATYVRERADAHTKSMLLEKWPEQVRVIDPRADVQLCWREVELVSNFSVAVPLRPLPWCSVDASLAERAAFVTLTEPPVIAAGMLCIREEFQFEGMYFRVALDVMSPHGTGTRVVIYESVTEPKFCVELFQSKSMHGMCVLRAYIPVGTVGLSVEGSSLADFRSPMASEVDFLARCGPIVRQALLSQHLNTLHNMAARICRSYRKWFNAVKFRRTMTKLLSRVASMKKFLKGVVISKRLAIVAMCLRLQSFEQYCCSELGKINSSIYPFVKDCVRTPRHRRDAVVRHAVNVAKAEHLRLLRTAPSGTSIPRFRYVLPLEKLLDAWIAQMNVESLASQLMRRGSSLPRATIMLLRKKNSPVSIDSMARRRIASILRELLSCQRQGLFYAEEIIRQIREDEQMLRFQMEQQKLRIQEQQQTAVTTAACVARLATARPRKFKDDYALQQIAQIAAGSASRCSPEPGASALSSPSAHPEEPSLSAAIDPLTTPEARSVIPLRQSSQTKIALVCDSTSPIPRIIGNRLLVRSLLVSTKRAGDTTLPVAREERTSDAEDTDFEEDEEAS